MRRPSIRCGVREIISSAATACVWPAASYESPKYQSRRIPAAPGQGPAWYCRGFHDSESRRPRLSGRAARTRSIRHHQPCAAAAACSGGEKSSATALVGAEQQLSRGPAVEASPAAARAPFVMKIATLIATGATKALAPVRQRATASRAIFMPWFQLEPKLDFVRDLRFSRRFRCIRFLQWSVEPWYRTHWPRPLR